MNKKQISQLTPGEYFKLSENGKSVFVFGKLVHWKYVMDYSRIERKYGATNANNINDCRYFAPGREVYVGFEY